MEARIQWFGLSWAVVVVVCLLACAYLLWTARRVRKQGQERAASRLVLAAFIEGAAVSLDLVIRIGVSALSDQGLNHWILDGWTLVRPLAHASAVFLVVKAIRSMISPGAKGPIRP